MAVLCRLAVDWPGEVEFFDNDTGSHVKVRLDYVNKLFGGALGGTVRFDEEREGFGDTNGVRQLNKGPAGKLGVYERFGDPSGEVCSRSIDLGIILSGESTSTMGTPATVGVDNDLSSSQASVTLRTTNDEETRGLNLVKSVIRRCTGATRTYVVDGAVVQVLLRDDLLDDLLLDLFSENLSGDIWTVLGADDDSVDSLGNNGTTITFVFNGDLGLGIGSQPWQAAIETGIFHGFIEFVGEEDGKRE